MHWFAAFLFSAALYSTVDARRIPAAFINPGKAPRTEGWRSAGLKPRMWSGPSNARKTSKRKVELDKAVDKDKLYDINEAISIMKTNANAKFVETAELHANLKLNPRYNDQQIRSTVVLPNGAGKDVRVAVLAKDAQEQEALDAGADLVGWEELVQDISGGKLDFDILLATPAAMPMLAKLGKILGPKGLMPSPKAGTVSADPAAAVKEFKAGKLEFRLDKQGIIHVPFGKVNFDDAKLKENLDAIVEAIETNRPSGVKGKMWKTASISSSMGPSMYLDLSVLGAK
jgi:large subunit ribosomal protein L1